ncbi:MAG: hypothetical protein HZB13_18485 [Acidobacteria bacterium]|nr:hypothetical protein [Acidobacteriota bacterium]
MKALWLLLPLSVVAAWWWKGVEYPPGIVVTEEPRQTAAGGVAPWEKNGHTIRPLAEYSIRARLLGRAQYWFDGGAKFSPLDLAVAWGVMSDQNVLDRLSWSQSWRYLNWQPTRGGWPLPFDQLNSHSANIHIVPADSSVLGAIGMARRGQVIRMSGYLIEITGPQGAHWSSSLSRTDSGGGACELMWVKEFSRE